MGKPESVGEKNMISKPIIKTKKVKSLLVTIQHVFRANFNDTYWLEEITINLDELDKEKLTWFDPYAGRSKLNNTLVAVVYVSDDKFVILEKKDNVITEKTREKYTDCIICEDFDESMLLASHIRINY